MAHEELHNYVAKLLCFVDDSTAVSATSVVYFRRTPTLRRTRALRCQFRPRSKTQERFRSSQRRNPIRPAI